MFSIILGSTSPSGVFRTLIVSGLDANSRYALDLNLNIEGMSYRGFIGDLFVYLATRPPQAGSMHTGTISRCAGGVWILLNDSFTL